MVGRSLARVEDAINHLREFFGPDKAIEIPSEPPRACWPVTIGRQLNESKRLKAFGSRSIYRLEHIRTNSSGKVVAK